MTSMSQPRTQPDPMLFEMVHGKSPYGVAVFDRGLRLIYANSAWSTFIPASTPIVGTMLRDLFPDAGELQHAARTCLQTCESIRLSVPGRSPADGATNRYITLSPIVDGGQAVGVICLCDDETAQTAAERASAVNVQLEAFREQMSQALAGSDDVDTVLQALADALVEHVGVASARIWVLDGVDDVYQLRASAGGPGNLDGQDARIPAGRMRQARIPEPRFDIAASDGALREPDWMEAEGQLVHASYPFVVHGTMVGFMRIDAEQDVDVDVARELGGVADAVAQFLERKRAESALRERKQLFDNVLESAADGLVIYDLESTKVLEVNWSICRMHGYSRSECLQLKRADLVHPDWRPHLVDYLTAVTNGQPGRVRLMHQRKDGSVFPADIQGSPIVYRGRPAALSIVRDVTREQEEQERLEQRVVERTQELSLLLDVSRNVASMRELKPLLDLILQEVRAAVEYEGAGILTLEGEVLMQAAQRGPELDGLSTDLRLPLATAGMIAELLQDSEPLVIPDVWSDTVEARAYREVVTEAWLRERPYIRSWVGVPLRVRDRTVGLLVITYGETNHFTDHHVRLLKAVAAQAAVAIENARLMAGARDEAALEERQRLARELHDAVTQTLFSASLIGDVLPTLWTRKPERALEALEDLRKLTRGALAEMRTLLFELRPNALTEVPLGDLLRHLADATTGHARVPVAASIQSGQILPPDVQVAFYRIAQEALNNVIKHAEATEVSLQLREVSGGSLELTITDNGRGFDLAQTTGGHFGLRTMHERAGLIGARLEVTSAPGQGTGIVVMWSAADHIAAEEH